MKWNGPFHSSRNEIIHSVSAGMEIAPSGWYEMAYSDWNEMVHSILNKMFIPWTQIRNMWPGHCKEPGHYCRGEPNGSVVNYKNIIQRLTNYITYPICEPACSYYQYNAVEVQKQQADRSIIELVFDDTIYVTRSKYEFTFFPILTTLGGQIGLCRTVVWLGLSVIGLNKIFLFLAEMWRAPWSMQTHKLDE